MIVNAFVENAALRMLSALEQSSLKMDRTAYQPRDPAILLSADYKEGELNALTGTLRACVAQADGIAVCGAS